MIQWRSKLRKRCRKERCSTNPVLPTQGPPCFAFLAATWRITSSPPCLNASWTTEERRHGKHGANLRTNFRAFSFSSRLFKSADTLTRVHYLPSECYGWDGWEEGSV